jgi:hypothetical protein
MEDRIPQREAGHRLGSAGSDSQAADAVGGAVGRVVVVIAAVVLGALEDAGSAAVLSLAVLLSPALVATSLVDPTLSVELAVPGGQRESRAYETDSSDSRAPIASPRLVVTAQSRRSPSRANTKPGHAGWLEQNNAQSDNELMLTCTSSEVEKIRGSVMPVKAPMNAIS